MYFFIQEGSFWITSQDICFSAPIELWMTEHERFRCRGIYTFVQRIIYFWWIKYQHLGNTWIRSAEGQWRLFALWTLSDASSLTGKQASGQRPTSPVLTTATSSVSPCALLVSSLVLSGWVSLRLWVSHWPRPRKGVFCRWEYSYRDL